MDSSHDSNKPVAWASQTAIQMLHRLSPNGCCLTSLDKSKNDDEAVPLYAHPAPPSKVVEAAQQAVESYAGYDLVKIEQAMHALRKALEESR